ncbi:glycosyltransferase [Mesoaciditoga lauensis]|uniref:glycosyltransferase n=1 Tax=Mesoaciditoga lauensis TaxID=1495039 RepID=UPI00056B6CF8|nr:glycosyltransferase family 2 protein [Mesoaciditoga lauensis]
MFKTNTLKKIMMLSSEISAVLILFAFRTRSIPLEWFFPLLFGIFSLSSFLLFEIRLKREKMERKKIFHGITPKDVLIFTVIKNDIISAKRFIEHYGRFPHNFHILVFDDNSTDGTYEYLLKAFKNVEIRRLIRSGRVLHPKGEGFEIALKDEKSDFVFICDGDSLISLDDLNFLILTMEKEKLDYVSAQRRNIEKEKISYYSADINELFMSLMNEVVSIFGGSIFPGSGHLIRKESFKTFKYNDVCLSDDTYIGNWIAQHKKKGRRIYSASVMELAPEKFSVKLSQMLKWTKNGVLERIRSLSMGVLIQYFALFMIIFSFLFPKTYLALITYGVLATLFGIILGMALSFKSFKGAILGFLLFSLELFFSTVYNVYLYNRAIFSNPRYLESGKFEKTKRE